ncbi:hypothetical protein Tco_0097422 [Tanacetum coccineum]
MVQLEVGEALQVLKQHLQFSLVAEQKLTKALPRASLLQQSKNQEVKPSSSIPLESEVIDSAQPEAVLSKRTIDQAAGGKLHDKNTKESWVLLEDLAVNDNESWNDPRDFAKQVKAISLPQDVPSTSERHLIELKNQVQRLMEAYLAPKSSVQVNKIASSCEIYSGPHDTQYCMENPEQAFVEYASSLPPSSNTQFVCTKENDGDIMFVEIIKKYDDSNEEELEEDGSAIMRKQLELGEDPEGIRGISNFTRRIRGMHIFVGNFTYVSDFMIVEDISSIIDPRLWQVVLGRPFVEISNMTHDLTLGIVRNDEDKRRGVDCVMNKILGFYKECLDLGPEYGAGLKEGEVIFDENKLWSS